MKDKIVTLVLMNGAEIIGKFVDDNGEVYTLNRPRLLQPGPQGVGLVNGVCMSGTEPKGDMDFNKSGVIFVIETMDDLAKGYQQQVSGLVLPTDSLKVK